MTAIRLLTTTLPALVCTLFLATSTSFAAPTPVVSFRDGGRHVIAQRSGPPRIDAHGRKHVPVRLHMGARTFDTTVDDRAIVRVEPGTEVALVRNGLRIVEPLMPSIGLYLVEDREGNDDGLAIAARVEHATPNFYLQAEPTSVPFIPNDSLFESQWFFDTEHLNAPEIWADHRGSSKTTIVVIDSGCDLGHPDLVNKLDPGLDVVDGDDDPSFDPSYHAPEHGTASAGLVGAETNNAAGIAGACPDCRIRCVRLLDDKPVALSAHIKALNFALETGAAVVSNSWVPAQGTPVFAAMRAALENLYDNGRHGMGTIIMFSAGNDSRKITEDEIFGVRGVTTIGAVTSSGAAAGYGNHGSVLDLAALEGNVTTDIRGAAGLDSGDYTSIFGGTSSSCPIAAGFAGLLADTLTKTTAPNLVNLMIRTARKTVSMKGEAKEYDESVGYGLIDPALALKVGIPEDAARPEPKPIGAITVDSGGFSCSYSPPSSSHWLQILALVFVIGRRLAGGKRRLLGDWSQTSRATKS
jgi:subtilisin family serine protease